MSLKHGLLPLVLISLLLCSFYSFTLDCSGHLTSLPIHAEETLARCRALHVKPSSVPAGFYEREESDRHERRTKPVWIRNATIWTGKYGGREIINGDVLVKGGIISALVDIPLQQDIQIIDAHGAWLTPGIVDMHSHLGIQASPELTGAADANSPHGPVLPWLRSLDAINTHDKGFESSIAGGVTTSLILPGSGNAIGGQAFPIKLRPTSERSPSSMLVEPPFSPNGTHLGIGGMNPTKWRHIKHACGENPSGSYHASRMDTVWSYRQVYNKARQLKQSQDAYCSAALAGKWESPFIAGKPFPEDLQWEAAVDVLRGRVKVQTHCYEAVDMDAFLRVAREFEFEVAAFHHASEAWLITDVLKKAYGKPPAIALFASFARYKKEAFRSSEYAPAVLDDEGIDVVMKSDHPAIVSRYLIHEAAQAHYHGLPSHVALTSVTSTPARIMGLGYRVGKVAVGMDADLVLWDAHPLTLGATPLQVWIDGIAQLPTPAKDISSLLKYAEDQKVPRTPDFKREKDQARRLDVDGLPDLWPQRTRGMVKPEAMEDVKLTVMFVNVSAAYVRKSQAAGLVALEEDDGSGIVALFDHAQDESSMMEAKEKKKEGGIVVVQDGKILCFDSRPFSTDFKLSKCLTNLTTILSSNTADSEMEYLDLHYGALQPGLTTIGSTLGLQEIALESTMCDGPSYDPLEVDLNTGGMPEWLWRQGGGVARAIDGLMWGTRDALLAYRSGVTTAITSPSASFSTNVFFHGLSAAFSIGSPNILERGSVIKDITAIHVELNRRHAGASVSTRIGILRKILEDAVYAQGEGEMGDVWRDVVTGRLPLVVNANSADIIASLVALKRSVEALPEFSGAGIRMVILGGAEAHLVAKELGEAGVGVVLSPPRPLAYTWDYQRTLPGPPLTNTTNIGTLLAANVTLGLGPQGTSAEPALSAWAVRNLRWDVGWALASYPDLTKTRAIALGSTAIERMLNIDIDTYEADIVATSGGDLIGYEGKVVAVISGRRGKVDIF